MIVPFLMNTLTAIRSRLAPGPRLTPGVSRLMRNAGLSSLDEWATRANVPVDELQWMVDPANPWPLVSRAEFLGHLRAAEAKQLSPEQFIELMDEEQTINKGLMRLGSRGIDEELFFDKVMHWAPDVPFEEIEGDDVLFAYACVLAKRAIEFIESQGVSV